MVSEPAFSTQGRVLLTRHCTNSQLEGKASLLTHLGHVLLVVALLLLQLRRAGRRLGRQRLVQLRLDALPGGGVLGGQLQRREARAG